MGSLNYANNLHGIKESQRDAKSPCFQKVDILSLLSMRGQRISETILGKMFEFLEF